MNYESVQALLYCIHRLVTSTLPSVADPVLHYPAHADSPTVLRSPVWQNILLLFPQTPGFLPARGFPQIHLKILSNFLSGSQYRGTEAGEVFHSLYLSRGSYPPSWNGFSPQLLLLLSPFHWSLLLSYDHCREYQYRQQALPSHFLRSFYSQLLHLALHRRHSRSLLNFPS